MLKQQVIKKLINYFRMQDGTLVTCYFCYNRLYQMPDVNILNYLPDALSVYMTNAKNEQVIGILAKNF